MCQIVRGVKLSVFASGIKLSAVSNCPRCQIGLQSASVTQILLRGGAALLALNANLATDGATFICCKLGHQVMPRALVANFATRSDNPVGHNKATNWHFRSMDRMHSNLATLCFNLFSSFSFSPRLLASSPTSPQLPESPMLARPVKRLKWW